MHPCLPVPRDEQRRQTIGAHLALSELDADPDHAADELASVAAVCAALLDDCAADEAREAVQKAAGALVALRTGQGSIEAAKAACTPLVAIWVELLRTVTLRRLLQAQAAARKAQAELAEAV